MLLKKITARKNKEKQKKKKRKKKHTHIQAKKKKYRNTTSALQPVQENILYSAKVPGR